MNFSKRFIRYAPGKCRKAFSLIELLVVIVILAVLTSIIIVGIGQVRSRSEGVKCAAGMRQYLQAVPLYMADNDGKLPACYHGAVDGEVAGHLAVYMSAPAKLEGIELVRWAKRNVTCPVDTWGYAFNSWTSNLRGGEIENPSTLIYVMDHTSLSGAIRPITFTGLPNDFRQKTPRPHHKRINVGFLDSHVESRLASSLVWADFTRGTPSYLKSHETRDIASNQYDQ